MNLTVLPLILCFGNHVWNVIMIHKHKNMERYEQQS